MLNSSINLAIEHIDFSHATSTGWITMAQKDATTNHFKQYHYTAEELASHLAEWSGENVYFSQNTFYRPKRAIDTIRELRSIYVDIDTYTKGLSPEWVLGKLELEYFGQSLPNPNMVLMSGRGLVVFWNIEPVPYKAMPLWKAVETHFISILKELGSDPKASDPTRIFRLAGSINSKNGAVVKAQYRHTYRYQLRQLQYDYLPELTPSQTQNRRPGRKPKVINLFNMYTLHLARTIDICKLIELREGDVGNCREVMCFLYRYWTCCYSNDPEQALEETKELNMQFKHPLPDREVIRATKSAEKAWSAKSNAKADAVAKELGFKGAGYNLKNETIIQWLEITPEEQEHMSTIISASEKRRRKRKRDRLYQQEKRKEKGIKNRQQAVEDRVNIIIDLITDNPTISNVQIAKRTGIPRSTVVRLRKQTGL